MPPAAIAFLAAVAVAGGFRAPLVSDGSVYETVTSVHQTAGPMLCSGTGTEEAADIETADPLVRTLEATDSVMKGAFQSKKTRGAVRYEYSVSWSVTRQPSPR